MQEIDSNFAFSGCHGMHGLISDSTRATRSEETTDMYRKSGKQVRLPSYGEIPTAWELCSNYILLN